MQKGGADVKNRTTQEVTRRGHSERSLQEVCGVRSLDIHGKLNITADKLDCFIGNASVDCPVITEWTFISAAKKKVPQVEKDLIGGCSARMNKKWAHKKGAKKRVQIKEYLKASQYHVQDTQQFFSPIKLEILFCSDGLEKLPTKKCA